MKSRSMQASSLSLISHDSSKLSASTKLSAIGSSLSLSSSEDTMILAVLRFRINPPSLDETFDDLWPLLLEPAQNSTLMSIGFWT